MLDSIYDWIIVFFYFIVIYVRDLVVNVEIINNKIVY